MTGTSTGGLSIGQAAPRFELPDTEGKRRSLDEPADALARAVIFTCNHCPYALAWHDRLMEVGREYAPRGVAFFAVNSNDGERYPADSFERMQQRTRAEEWSMPYLHDRSQEVARSYGARTTPDVFVLDRDGWLRYRGAPDGDYADPGQAAAWLRDALDDLLAGVPVRRPETKPVGCSIKWRA
jgi:peroxiredoxin